ncbi:hypothetical protein ACUNWD_12525 [Sunxiuqinia sp. A32]|uniref:hypothetical protein n=1 Tax=Sunxiuqinia sp. A32 TaxID=3461496 RepID=UPI0040464C06
MKQLMLGFFLVAVISILPSVITACEIEYKILENEKEYYQKGDVLVVKVKVIYTHKQCPEGIDATKFSFDGLKVLGATKWKQITSNEFERKFKIEVSKDSSKKLVFGTVRKCDKEGGAGSIKLQVG